MFPHPRPQRFTRGAGAGTACVEEFREKAKAVNTRRAYRADWEHFARWCETRGRTGLPAKPATV